MKHCAIRLFVCCILACNVALAQEEAQATADQVLAKFVDALGGELTLLGNDNATIRGTLKGSVYADDGEVMVEIDGSIKLLYKSEKFFVEMDSETAGISSQGFDGVTWWCKSVPTSDRRTASREERIWTQSLLFCSQQAVHWSAMSPKTTALKDETFAGKEAHDLVRDLGGEDRVHHYFDKSSGLLIGSKSEWDGQNFTSLYEFQEVDGIMCVNEIKMTGDSEGGIQFEYHFDFLEFDFDSNINDQAVAGPER